MASQRMALHLALLLATSRAVAVELLEDSAATCGEEDGTSQLQTGQRSGSLKPCRLLAPEVTKTCSTSDIFECIGRIENSGGVRTRLPHGCAASVTRHEPGAHVYEVTNDGAEEVTFTPEQFCFGPDQGVDFSYAMSCFGAQDGRCVEEGCMSCKDGTPEHSEAKCVLKPGETKYMTVWYAEAPKCCQIAQKDITKTCEISNLMECIGGISNEESVDTHFSPACAEKNGLSGDLGAAVYKVKNDMWKSQSLKGEDFCFHMPFQYAMSCFGTAHGHCEDQGCINCEGGEVSPEGETCDFKAGEEKYMIVWFEKPGPKHHRPLSGR